MEEVVKSKALEKAMEKVAEMRGPIIIDCGAFTGGVAEKIIALNKSSKVYAVEACPDNFRELTSRAQRIENLYPVNTVISDHDGVETFYSADIDWMVGSSQSSSVYKGQLKEKIKKRKINGYEKHKLPCMTLDTFIKSHGIIQVNLLKSNCEGAEYKIFSGPTKFLENTNMISLSIHTKGKFFSGDDFVKARKNIYKKLDEHSFMLVEGERLLQSKKHLNQLWVRA